VDDAEARAADRAALGARVRELLAERDGWYEDARDLAAALEALTDPEGHILHGASGSCTGECQGVRVVLDHHRRREEKARIPQSLLLTQDDMGLRVDVPDLDMSNPTVIELVSALRRGDVDQIKQTLVKYETHVGAGDARLKEIKDDIAAHVQKEEQILWKKVDAISEAQRAFAEAVLQRISSMEAKMPNGEIQEMIKALARLEANVIITAASARKAEEHVIEHDEEANECKQRLVALEAARKGVNRRK
jgi:hypothetical protein